MNLKSTSAVGTTHDQSINKREKVVENPEKAASASQSHLEMSMKYERTMVCCNTQIKRSEYMEITDSRCRLNQPYFPPKKLSETSCLYCLLRAFLLQNAKQSSEDR